ncbi:polysaccharide pyruvyl transferase family protein [Sphingobacterium bovisgrunnientis]|uniref:polysaccharide pyruvyl transferase family protein n=1 Tax=Sphingobacterium bovisgrunnientis TaxID=1874697 RepID=UPI0013579AE9|nr:polysaccharide pyruvyl transferase family protein [Sphingobacterium bovisgrunnientis]
MKFGLLNYENGASGKFNVGDHIQSLAAKQFLPKIDDMIYRDRLNEYDGKDEIKVIMNGWYTHKPLNWPPAASIKPLFVSFHLNSAHAPILLSKKENIDYLKKHSPIGCRDFGTVKFLEDKGIDCYYSACLTTTLGLKYKSDDRNDKIYMVDVLYKDDYKQLYKDFPIRILSHLIKGKIFKMFDREKKIKKIIPSDILNKAEYLTHSYWNKDYSESERFEIAEDLLRKFSKAKLVITSRIHCALPCLAMGTPVVFIGGGGLTHPHEMSRLKGTIELLNVVLTDKVELSREISDNLHVLDPQKIDWENIKNPTFNDEYTKELINKCRNFIQS